jgi:hypothetical protein
MKQVTDSNFQNYIANLQNAIVHMKTALAELDQAAATELKPNFVDEAVAIHTDTTITADAAHDILLNLLEEVCTVRDSARHVYSIAKEIDAN